MRFSIRNTSFYFDKNGDPPTGYDIVTWEWTNGLWSFKVVGNYSPSANDLHLDDSQIDWSGQVSPVTNVSVSFFIFSIYNTVFLLLIKKCIYIFIYLFPFI